MAYVSFYNKTGPAITLTGLFPLPVAMTTTTINATGESLSLIGQIQLSSGPGTSKVISSAGGKIWFPLVGAQTFATAGSTVRVGIQDVVTTTGLEDGTWDVYDDLVQGTDTFVTATVKEVAMSSGTKTIAHGDIIAVVIDFTTRNGSDSIAINRGNIASIFPYTTVDSTGAGPVKGTTGTPMCAIQFDDGTIGHFGDWTLPFVAVEPSFGSGSTPDEYAMVFQLPFKCKISTLLLHFGAIAAGDDATVHLIRDPFGTITNLVTATIDPDIATTVSGPDVYVNVEIAETEILANTEYAISYRPTSTGLRVIRTISLANSALRSMFPINALGATRTDLGSFTSSSISIPDFGFRISQVDDGSATATSAETTQFFVILP